MTFNVIGCALGHLIDCLRQLIRQMQEPVRRALDELLLPWLHN